MLLQTIWYVPLFAYTERFPLTITFWPSEGTKSMLPVLPLNITQDIIESLSLREKYQWPVLEGLKLESSPSTSTVKKEDSSTSFMSEVRLDTVKIDGKGAICVKEYPIYGA